MAIYRQIILAAMTLKPGVDWAQAIKNTLRQCTVVLAIIGPAWSQTREETGRRRIDDPDDPLRAELVVALQYGVYIIPVLVDHADMPRSEQLPTELQRIAGLHALEVADARWDYDSERLIQAVAEKLGKPAVGKSSLPVSRPSFSGKAMISLIIMLTLLFTGSEFLLGRGQVVIFIALAVIALAFAASAAADAWAGKKRGLLLALAEVVLCFGALVWLANEMVAPR